MCIEGRDATVEPPERGGIGLVFQRAALFPHFDVRGNIGYGLEARGERPDVRRRRVDEVVEALGLTALVVRPVATLSGGEAQRVAIARAVAPRPKVLLLDEPTPVYLHRRVPEVGAGHRGRLDASEPSLAPLEP